MTYIHKSRPHICIETWTELVLYSTYCTRVLTEPELGDHYSLVTWRNGCRQSFLWAGGAWVASKYVALVAWRPIFVDWTGTWRIYYMCAWWECGYKVGHDILQSSRNSIRDHLSLFEKDSEFLIYTYHPGTQNTSSREMANLHILSVVLRVLQVCTCCTWSTPTLTSYEWRYNSNFFFFLSIW